MKLVVAKCWDPNPKGYFTVSKQEPVRPIDPSAWVAHTQAHTGNYPAGFNNIQPPPHKSQYRMTHSVSTFGSNSSLTTSLADTTISTTYSNGYNNYHQNGGLTLGTTITTNGDSSKYCTEQLNLTVKTDMDTLTRAMAAPDSGLDVRDRNWLKITIPNAFIGADVVDWLFNHVEGFPERRDARKYACDMLKYGYIRHVVNKIRFSEQCYYVFGDFNQNSQMGGPGMPGGNLFTLNEESEVDFDSVSELDRDTIYSPMNFPPPGSFNNNNNNNNIYQHQPKIYSNLNGIGGPPPPPLSYMSSSSSNATSNSTSTTSNNTTSQTIATMSSAAVGANGGNGMGGGSSSGMGGSVASSNYNGIINSDRSNPCQFYYPSPSALSSFNQSSVSSFSSASMFQKQANMYSHNESSNQTTQQSQYDSTNYHNNIPPANSMLTASSQLSKPFLFI